MTPHPESRRTSSLFGLLAVLVVIGTLATGLRLPALDGSAASLVGVIFLAFTLSDVTVLVALAAGMVRARPPRLETPKPVSVLVAAWNEREVIERSVRGLLDQEGVELEVIVADDGSTDGTAEVVERAFDDRRVRVVRIPHGGKGAALEAARRVARHPLVATVDADTDLEPGALRRLASVMHGDVVAAGGAVLVKDADTLLGRFQFLEYVKTTWVRAAWAELSMLEQLPGAFSIFDARALERAGGFPIDSLTEDYEVSYRLYDEGSGHPMQIAFVPEARAWTAPPDSLAGFVGQRTRWFAGFLSTLVRFRRLIGRPRTGRFGLLRLPLKCLDTVAPIVGLLGVASLFLTAASSSSASLYLLALPLGSRALSDVGLYLAARSLVGEVSAERAPHFLMGRGGELAYAALDAFSYGILQKLAVLRAYPFAATRVRTWERSRTLAAPRDEAYVPAE